MSVVVMLLITTTAGFLMYNLNYEMFKKEIRNEAVLLSSCINTTGTDFLITTEKTTTRITLISEDGTVVYDNYANQSEMKNHSEREEILLAQKNGEGESYRYSETNSKLTYYYAIKLNDNSVIRVSGTHDTIYLVFVRLLPPAFLVVVIALLLSFVVSKKLAKIIVQPINEIDLENPDDFTSYDEIAPLLTKIKHLTNEIDDHVLELRQKKQEFDAITENMSEGFLIVDRKSAVVSSNSAVLRLFGVEHIENNESVFKINRNTEFTTAIDTALSGKRGEYVMSYSGRAYQIIANPVFDDNASNVLAAVIVILDVTDREKADKLRREFTANVSHELKTPLTSISGFAEIMMSGIVKMEDMQHFAGNIYKEAQRLITLVGDIIRLSRLDENSAPLEMEDINLMDEITSVTQRLETQAKKRNVTINVSGEAQYIKGASQIIDEMLYNIVDNAIKYNKDGGKIDIALDKTNEGVSLSVSDTGIGIPYADQQRVFERFYRVDKSHSKEIGGTGLGLSIVKHGAVFHNAQIRLNSIPTVGTKITIIF